MPAEWERHIRTWMAFPPPGGYVATHDPTALKTWVTAANTIAEFEPVTLLSHPSSADHVRGLASSGVDVVEVDLDDGWLRDNGPTFVLDDEGAPTAVNWVFNAWGGIQDHSRDAQIARTVADLAKVPTLDSSLGQ